MSETDNALAEEPIPFKVVLGLVDTAVFTTTGKHLSNIEVIVLQGSWQGLKYPQIAATKGYTPEYLKNDIGPQLWKRLSTALGENVTKTNLRAVIQQRIYQNEQKSQKTEVEVLDLAQQSSIASQDFSSRDVLLQEASGEQTLSAKNRMFLVFYTNSPQR